MRVCLVGHGPSLEGLAQGSYIDSHDFVFRFKKGWQLCLFNPKDYGAKLDFLVASTEVPGCFAIPDEPKEFADLKNNMRGYIGYPKKGYYDEVAIEGAERAIEAPITVPLNLYNYWNSRFRELGGKHRNVSVGLAGVIAAAHEIRPKHITLAGFDTLLDPTLPFARIESVPRTGSGPFPDHDWEAEHKLLGILADEYHFTVGDLSPPASDEIFKKEPDFHERNYGEYAEEKLLDDRL